MNNKINLVLLIIFTLSKISAQITLPIPTNIQQSFDKNQRSMNGLPGVNYWQNSANYNIEVSFDPTTRKISGKESIIYYNNSPKILNNLLFKLYPNLYQKGAIRLSKVEPEDVTEGMKIVKIIAPGGKVIENPKADGTNLEVNLATLAPKSSIELEVYFEYTLNQTSHYRTGMVDEGAYFIAYFFPRIAVFDDIDGWNKLPYLGNYEFYNDFCNFKLAVSVPSDYLVWATGDFVNCSSVLQGKYCERLAAAEKSDTTINIIDENDLKNGKITYQNNSNTFHFQAKNVTDMVFAVSNHYVWQSSSLVVDSSTMRRTRVDAVFNHEHKDFYEVLDFNKKTVSAMSFDFPKVPYPYSHETVFDGLDQMEYPMMVNDNPLEDRAESIELTDHEVFHTLFPFYMGINESKYGWMDEGWATIGEWLISPMIDTTIVDDYGVDGYEKAAGSEADLPIITLTNLLTGTTAFINAYPKPAMGYLFAKDILGDTDFYKGLHYYMDSWHGKHPIPNDFFNCMNVGSGNNLNWFWKNWFYENGVPDLAIGAVTEKRKCKKITIQRKGAKFVPIDLTINYQDGSSEKLHQSAAAWKNNETATIFILKNKKTIKNITLGSTYTPDVDKSNNIYNKKQ